MGNGRESGSEGGGRVGRTVAESEPWWGEPPHPGEDAPNVVVILLDDTGFAQLGCYGSDIDTRHVDALAADGVQFTNFHVTPLCSPTRASLLTGRSQHAVRLGRAPAADAHDLLGRRQLALGVILAGT